MSPAVADPTTEYGAEPNYPVMPDYGPNNEDLPEQLKRCLLAAVKEVQATGRFVRRQEVLRDAKLRLYDEGIQHVYLNNTYSWTMATPGGSIPSGPNQKNGYFSEYIDDYPIFPAFGQIIRAKLSEHNPSIDFQPDDTNEPSDIESAKAAEALRHDYDRNNDVKLLQQQIVYHWQMGARAVVWTRCEDAPPRFGDISGNPPRRVISTVHGAIEAQVPIFANKREDYGYCILYDDPELKEAKSLYPKIADKLQAGAMCLDEGSYERIARLGIVQSSSGRNANGYGWNIGDASSHLISRGNAWLRANRFQGNENGMDDPFTEAAEWDVSEEAGEILTAGEKLAQLFPDGVHLVVVGAEYARANNQSIDDCLSVSHAYIGKGQSRMPIMWPMVVVQDRFNQGMNLIAESQDHLVPSVYFGGTIQEYAAISKQRAKPGAIRHMKDIPSGIKISDLVYREPDYQIPASAMQFLQFLNGALPEFMLACPPAMWGQSMADNKTAAGLQLAAAQAMGIQGALWDMEVQVFSDIYYQNCIAISNDEKYPDQITIPDLKGRRSVVDKASLTKGKFRCFPDKDSGFPESTNSQRQSMERTVALLAPTPLGMEIMGAPDNAAALVRLSGTGLVIPSALARDKQLREIEILLAQEPEIGDPNVLMVMRKGASVPVIIQAIDQARAAMLQQYQAMLQQQQVEHAGATIAAQVQGGAAPPPAVPPAPPDITIIAKPSVPIWPSDAHNPEGVKCQDYLMSDQCNTELTIGRPSADPMLNGQMVPNIAGVLNVYLHGEAHKNAVPLAWFPGLSGPLPAVGSPPTMAPQPAGS